MHIPIPSGLWARSPREPGEVRDVVRRRRALTIALATLRACALPFIGAGLLYAIDHGSVSNDEYAFLDWGRQLLHGSIPALQQRAFHPLPVIAGALLSLFGSATPTIVVLLSLALLTSLAIAGWRLAQLLRLPQPAPALAAALILSSPGLVLIAYSSYINLPFAVLILWALVRQLQGRDPRLVWTLLIVAGLVRPEGWAFLVAYGALRWWSTRGLASPRRRLASIALLCAAPAVMWLGIEWLLFGDPLYSLKSTRESVATSDVSGIRTFYLAFGVPLLVLCGVGLFAIARLAPRREAVYAVVTAWIAALTVGVLAVAGINTPSRHFSVLLALLCVFAAAGAVAPLQLLRRSGAIRGARGLALGGLAIAAVAAMAVPHAVTWLRTTIPAVNVTGATEATLARELRAARMLLDVRRAGSGAVAIVGSPYGAPLAYYLNVHYDAVADQPDGRTELIVEPSQETWEATHRAGVDSGLTRSTPPSSDWYPIVRGPWELYARVSRPLPLQLGAGPLPVQVG